MVEVPSGLDITDGLVLDHFFPEAFDLGDLSAERMGHILILLERLDRSLGSHSFEVHIPGHQLIRMSSFSFRSHQARSAQHPTDLSDRFLQLVEASPPTTHLEPVPLGIGVFPVAIPVHLWIPLTGTMPVRGKIFKGGVNLGEWHLLLLQVFRHLEGGGETEGTGPRIWHLEAVVVETEEPTIRHDNSLGGLSLILLQHLFFRVVEGQIFLRTIPHVVFLIGGELSLGVGADHEHCEMGHLYLL